MRTFILSLLTFVSVNVFAHYTFKADIPKNTFSYETVTPEQGKVEYVTDGIVITFPDFIGHVNSDAIFILYKNGEPIAPMYAEKAPENGKSIILKFKNIDSGTLFAEGGEYTINFPEKIVYNAFYGLDEERYNPAFTLTYSVLKNTFNYETVTPAQGKVEYVTDGIVITFPKLIGYVNSDVNFTLKKDGVAKAPMYAEIDTENGHNVVLKFKNISGAIFTETGTYTIDFPEKIVYNAFYGLDDERYNPAFTLTYNIGANEPEITPVVELIAELSPATVASNTEKLTMKFTSNASITLANATAAYFADKDGKHVGTASITAVEGKENEFTVSLISLPDGTYTLVIPEATFTTEKDGKTAYVAALEKTFTIDSSEADEFIKNFHAAIYNDKYGYIFDTDLNNFILVSKAPMFVDGTKAVKLVDYWDSSNVIRVGHMQSIAVEGWPYACKFVFDKPIVAGELEAGHYSIKIEEATIGDANFGKYLADPTSVKKSECNVNPRFTFTYDVDNDKAAEDEEPVEIVVLEAGFIPKTIESSTDTLLLKFISDEPVRLANSAAAYFKDKDGNMRTATIKAMDGSDIDFIVSWAGLDNGMYDLWLPEATFTTEKDGKTAHVGALKLTFTIDISEADKFKEEFYPAIYNDKYGYIFDTFFNDFILISEAPMFVDETKEVQLVEFWNADISIRKGHMQPIELEGWPYACKFIFDKPIKTGELKAGQYTIILEEATVGDENFGKYLADHTSVKKSECNVNPRFTFNYNVDNKATAITDINADDNAEKVIYTITGRRIKNMNAPGIYIVNGKKVIKK